jgi:glycosyltransferase involved in cell wall biosynthesis
MRILVVATSLPTPEHPALGTFSLRHAQSLALWADVTIAHVLYTQASDGREVGVDATDPAWLRISVPGTKVGRQFKSARAVAELARGFDVVHSMAFESLMACRTVQAAGLAWVHTEHAQNFHHPVGGTTLRAWQAGVTRLERRPELVTAVSAYLAEGIARSGRTLPIRIVPNVIDVGNAHRSAEQVDGRIRIVSVGRLVPSKQPLTAVRAVAEVRSWGIAAELTWIGDGSMLGDLDAEASRLGVSEHVTVVPFMDADRYVQYLAGFDVFLLPTLHETFCVAAAEAIAVGLPVVIGDQGGQRDFITDGNGVLVPASGTALQYAEAIRSVALRKPRIPEPKDVQTMRTTHSRAAVAEAFHDAYLSVGLH